MTWFQNNWGNLASVLGVVIALLAAWNARRAKQVAASALDVVEKSTFALDLGVCSENIAELRSRCDAEDWPGARREVHISMEKLERTRSRWANQVTLEESKQAFNSIAAQLDIIRGQLVRFRKKPPTGNQLAALDEALGVVAARIAGERGRYEMAAARAVAEHKND